MREMTSFKNVYGNDNRINLVVFLMAVDFSYYTYQNDNEKNE
jgi:hypothetical protein